MPWWRDRSGSELWHDGTRMVRVTPPKNVRLVHMDGETVGCELFYVGQDEDGTHQWRVTADMSTMLLPGWRLECEELPPRTGLQLDIDPGRMR